jgi:hypothetical protein
MPSLLQIVVHTPPWVWLVMAAIIALGLYGLRTRIVSPWRLAILPLVGVGTSLTAIVQSTQPVLTTGAWLLALLASLPLGGLLGRRRPAQWLADGRLEIAGGWFVLVFALSIFVVRYVLGVVFGVAPALRFEPFWIALAGGAGGVIAGIGTGWLAGLLLRARRTLAVAR